MTRTVILFFAKSSKELQRMYVQNEARISLILSHQQLVSGFHVLHDVQPSLAKTDEPKAFSTGLRNFEEVNLESRFKV